MIAACALAFAPAALAQVQGGSAVGEYTENVPGAGGDHATGSQGGGGGGGESTGGGGSGGGGGGDGGGGGGEAVPSSANDDFEAAGTDGASAADLAESTAPPEPSSAAGGGGGANADQSTGGGGGKDSSGAQTPTRSPSSVTMEPGEAATATPASNATGTGGGEDGGPNWVFVAALALLLAAAVGYAFYRRRQAGEDQARRQFPSRRSPAEPTS